MSFLVSIRVFFILHTGMEGLETWAGAASEAPISVLPPLPCPLLPPFPPPSSLATLGGTVVLFHSSFFFITWF